MVDTKHLELLHRGLEAIEKWRKDNPKEILNLEGAHLNGVWLFEANISGANLKNSIFERANLTQANLNGCDLSGANFSDAVLVKTKFENVQANHTYFMNTNFTKANCKGSKLSNSTFFGANLFGADLSNVNFSESNMTNTDFSLSKLNNTNLSNSTLLNSNFFASKIENSDLSNSELAGANFLNAQFNKVNIKGSELKHTILANVNLNELVGFSKSIHLGPSHVDFSTISLTFSQNNNSFSPKIEEFLLTTGITRDLLKAIPKILCEKKYCDAFVCYGQPDVKFAEKIVNDLRSRGVSCWIYSLDSTVGAPTWKEIKSKRSKAEKMIVLCSSEALVRDGVLKEIEEQIDEDPEKIIPISLDELWKHKGFPVKRGSHDLKPFLLRNNYADFTNSKKYKKTLNKLLEGLEEEVN